jgi:outer membrane protein assembly factor BamB
LRTNDSIIVHGLDRDPKQVASARESIRAAGGYGPVSIEELKGNRLPYLNEIANLIVAEEPYGIEEAEIQRVLRPGGSAYLKIDGKWVLTTKPWPNDIDDWSHYLHDAGGNTVAHDTVVGPPRHMKWVGSPRWSRHHDRMACMSALVSEAGRLFYIMDEGSRISIQMPPKWELVARDAFNGVVLWKRPITEWHSHMWPLKSGPTQLARRLVAVNGHVFATLGIKAPVSMLNATSGVTIREFEGSGGTEELIVTGSTLFLTSYKDKTELEAYLPETGRVGDQAKVAARYKWDELPRVVMAFDTRTGKQLWNHVSRISPLTICSDGDRFYYHDGDKVIARDSQTGEQLWFGGETDRRKKMTINFGPKLVVEEGQVYFAGGDRKMHVYDAETGEELWNAPHARGGYQSPEDLIVMKDMVWSAPLTSGKDSGTFTGRDIHTGEVVKEFSPDVDTYWFHHRCYIAKATDRFLIPSRTGIEFVDPETESWDINHWVRGGCLYGVMPANGLTYAPPHNCACYPEAKLYGFNALSSSGPNYGFNNLVPDPDRLSKGPAYGNIDLRESGPLDWPTYRSDSARSGYTNQNIRAALEPAWETKLGGKPSAPTSAAGKIFVAQIDQHTVHALDSKTGAVAWSFTAGSRVDSPPTYHRGALLFGSADGHVYCLRADDGALAWKFRAAPGTERHMAFEQLESVWPVHGSILVEQDQAYFVAGRSNFLDGGLLFYKVDPFTGDLLAWNTINQFDPETGKPLQDKIATLQMPAGLPDILAYHGGYVYMRSQAFDSEGNRHHIGPHSGDAATQGAVQREGEHLFAPMSYLDGTYFHRAYWVMGKSFAGGHNGYYQAGKNTPSGRILVADAENVYGFGRKPEYLRWTTTIEHQLFAASRKAPDGALTSVSVLDKSGRRSGGNNKSGGSVLRFNSAKSITPVGKPLGVEAWVKMTGKNGVILAHGGPSEGYAFVVRGSKPRFCYPAIPKDRNIIGRSGIKLGVLSDSKPSI